MCPLPLYFGLIRQKEFKKNSGVMSCHRLSYIVKRWKTLLAFDSWLSTNWTPFLRFYGWQNWPGKAINGKWRKHKLHFVCPWVHSSLLYLVYIFLWNKRLKKKKIPQDYHVRNTVRPNLAGGQHRCIHARERFSQFIVAIMIQEPFDSGLFSI